MSIPPPHIEAELAAVLAEIEQAMMAEGSASQPTVFDALAAKNYALLEDLCKAYEHLDTDYSMEPPLVRAARTGDVRALEILLRHGSPVDSTHDRGITALQHAILDEKAANLLLDYGADPGAYKWVSESPLFILLKHTPYSPLVKRVRDLLRPHKQQEVEKLIDLGFAATYWTDKGETPTAELLAYVYCSSIEAFIQAFRPSPLMTRLLKYAQEVLSDSSQTAIFPNQLRRNTLLVPSRYRNGLGHTRYYLIHPKAFIRVSTKEPRLILLKRNIENEQLQENMEWPDFLKEMRRCGKFDKELLNEHLNSDSGYIANSANKACSPFEAALYVLLTSAPLDPNCFLEADCPDDLDAYHKEVIKLLSSLILYTKVKFLQSTIKDEESRQHLGDYRKALREVRAGLNDPAQSRLLSMVNGCIAACTAEIVRGDAVTKT